jgi:ATP-dependent DNA helicase RecQ
MMLEGMIRKDIEEYGLLKITEAGQKFLKKPFSIEVSLNHKYADEGEDDEVINVNNASGAALDETLFKMLMELRKEVGAEYKVPPFVVFLENSIEDMATSYPTTMAELEKIVGVSKGKALRYGKKFIELIANYVEENEIEKSDEFVMKSVVNKSGMKVFIITNIDKRIPLETIAKNKGISMSELLGEMETIVASGTKLNISYCIDDELDEDEQEDIFDYFKNSQDDDLEAVYDEFKDQDVSIETLQLMRIMFLSEFGN